MPIPRKHCANSFTNVLAFIANSIPIDQSNANANLQSTSRSVTNPQKPIYFTNSHGQFCQSIENLSMQRQSSPIDCHSVRTNRKDLMELVLYGSCWSQRGTIIQPPALQFVPVNSMSILCQSTKTIDAIKYECCQSVSNSRPISYHPANP